MDFIKTISLIYILTCLRIKISSGCHVAQRRSSSKNDVLIKFFGKCMTEIAGVGYKWDAIARFTVEDSQWYEDTNGRFCKGEKSDTKECWESQLAFLVDKDSYFTTSIRRCLQKYTQQENDIYYPSFEYDDSSLLSEYSRYGDSRRAINPRTAEPTASEETPTVSTASNEIPSLIFQGEVNSSAIVARSGRRKRAVSTDTLFLLMLANQRRQQSQQREYGAVNNPVQAATSGNHYLNQIRSGYPAQPPSSSGFANQATNPPQNTQRSYVQPSQYTYKSTPKLYHGAQPPTINPQETGYAQPATQGWEAWTAGNSHAQQPNNNPNYYVFSAPHSPKPISPNLPPLATGYPGQNQQEHGQSNPHYSFDSNQPYQNYQNPTHAYGNPTPQPDQPWNYQQNPAATSRPPSNQYAQTPNSHYFTQQTWPRYTQQHHTSPVQSKHSLPNYDELSPEDRKILWLLEIGNPQTTPAPTPGPLPAQDTDQLTRDFLNKLAQLVKLRPSLFNGNQRPPEQVSPVITAYLCDAEAKRKFINCVSKALSVPKQGRLFSMIKMSPQDIISVFDFFRTNYSKCRSVESWDPHKGGVTRKCYSPAAARLSHSTCLSTIMLKLVRNGSQLHNIFLSCAS